MSTEIDTQNSKLEQIKITTDNNNDTLKKINRII